MALAGCALCAAIAIIDAPAKTSTPGFVKRAIARHFPASTRAAAIRVAACETGGTFNRKAVGDAGERGLFQIHPVHFNWANPARLFNADYNAWAAARLSHGGRDWTAWVCRP
jgi:hypothetical protein